MQVKLVNSTNFFEIFPKEKWKDLESFIYANFDLDGTVEIVCKPIGVKWGNINVFEDHQKVYVNSWDNQDGELKEFWKSNMFVAQAIFHELTHHEQYIWGDYETGNKPMHIIWRGVEYNINQTPYKERPWEHDADKKAAKLYQMFCRQEGVMPFVYAG